MTTIEQQTIDRGEAFIEHFGVKGMKWGQRKRTPGVSRSTDRMARKDAEEHARAKLFYGEGAGTRRKLSKATVNARKAHDPSYAKAFDAHLARQDLSTHATKAVKERKRTDRRDKTKKRVGYLARRSTGEMGTQAAFAAVAVAGVGFLSSPKARTMMKTGYNTVKTSHLHKKGAKAAADFLKNYS